METYKDFLQNKLLVENINSERAVFIPNNILDLLELSKFKNGKHRLFALIYYCNVTWIYRYAKVDNIFNSTGDVKGMLLEMCGVGNTNKNFDYIIKNNGVLDVLGITETINILDSPSTYYYDSDLDFLKFDSLRKYIFFNKYPNRTIFKRPVLAMDERFIDGVTYFGTFYDIEYTFKFDMLNYMYMLIDLKLPTETIGFYLYLLILKNCYGQDIKVSREHMSEYLGVGVKVITRMKKELKENNLIEEYSNGLGFTKINNTIKVKESGINGIIK